MLTIETVAAWLPPAGTAAVCAVSGGMDSMVLLHLLHEWCGERNIPLTAAHFNHRLRPTADRDEAFVRDWCAAKNIPFVSDTADVGAYAREHGLSPEEAGRVLRYGFLNRVTDRLRPVSKEGAFLYTAHHADDNAETILLNLIRGTGLRGLTGIPRRRGNIVRPLLDVSRAEIAEYAEAHGVPHVEDETNGDPAAASRNLVRREVLPLLRQLNPRAVEHLGNTGRQLAEIDTFLDGEARRRTAELEVREGTVSIPAGVLTAAPAAVRPRMVLYALDALGAGRRDVGTVHLDAALSLLEDGRPDRRVDLPGGVTARYTNGALVLEHRLPSLAEVELIPGEAVLWGRYCLTLEAGTPNLPQGNCLVIRDGTERLTVGPVRAGERLQLLGSRGRRTVKRLCLDRGIGLAERDTLPALYADGELAAVWRLGVDVSFLPKRRRCRVIHILEEDGYAQ